MGRVSKRPDFISKFMVAKFLDVKVWELNKVPHRYIEEASVILRGRHKARVETMDSIIEDTSIIPVTSSGKRISAEKIPYVLYRLMSMADF